MGKIGKGLSFGLVAAFVFLGVGEEGRGLRNDHARGREEAVHLPRLSALLLGGRQGQGRHQRARDEQGLVRNRPGRFPAEDVEGSIPSSVPEKGTFRKGMRKVPADRKTLQSTP